jgi:hypothetical protein
MISCQYTRTEMTMKTPTVDPGPLITFEWWLQWMETHGEIEPPLTQDETAIALSVASAHYYCHTLQEELPRSAGLKSKAQLSWFWGIVKVRERRAGRV